MNTVQELVKRLQGKLSSSTTLKQIPSILNPLPPYYKIDNINITNDFKKKSIIKDNLYFKYEFFRNTNLIAYVLIWNPNVKSHIHNHGDIGCFYKPLTTGLVEHRYITIEDYLHYVAKKDCCPTYTHFINDNMGLHSMENTNDFIASSIHIYENREQ